jgi:hypothetical protein
MMLSSAAAAACQSTYILPYGNAVPKAAGIAITTLPPIHL